MNVKKLAIHQMNSGIVPDNNLAVMQAAIAQAASSGAEFYFAPEMALLLDQSRKRAAPYIALQTENGYIPKLQETAQMHAIWLHIGSVALKSERDPGRWVNRSLLIDDIGQIVAQYDKMHLFDVDLESGESWFESKIYESGDNPVLADTPIGPMGLSICYDLRFPALYQALTQAGAHILTVPSAFTKPTGKAHWHSLLRARAIESQAFVVAAGQVGDHADGRSTYGHSLVVDPWGEILLDMGQDEGLGLVEIDLDQIEAVRRQIPAQANRRDIPDVRRAGF